MDVCSYIRETIGSDLARLQANGFRGVEVGHEQACIFLSKRHKIAIPWSIQDGLTCFLTTDLDSADESYPNWTPLWQTGVVSQTEDLDEFLAQFPEEDGELLRFIGAKLTSYLEAFGHSNANELP